jgi:CheY-like chemotaxis protein
MKILLVEDDREYLAMLTETLMLYGHTVYPASSVKEALTALATIDVEMILSDINMPNQPGTELYKRVRKDKSLKNVPFIYVTGNAPMAMATVLDHNELDFLVGKLPSKRLLHLVGDIAVHGAEMVHEAIQRDIPLPPKGYRGRVSPAHQH